MINLSKHGTLYKSIGFSHHHPYEKNIEKPWFFAQEAGTSTERAPAVATAGHSNDTPGSGAVSQGCRGDAMAPGRMAIPSLAGTRCQKLGSMQSGFGPGNVGLIFPMIACHLKTG